MKRDLLVGVLLAAVGLAGLAWHLEGPSGAGAATRAVLVCPLGGHGLEPAPFPPMPLASPARTRVPPGP